MTLICKIRERNLDGGIGSLICNKTWLTEEDFPVMKAFTMSSPFRWCSVACCEIANNGFSSLVAYFQGTIYEQNAPDIATLQSVFTEIINKIKNY